MSEFKVGDKFEIVKDMGEDYCEWGKKGTIITLVDQHDQRHAKFLYPSGKTWQYHFSDLRPLKPQTEAEKRGAKFGVGGVIKATGDKGVFWKSSSSYLGEEWYLFMNDGNILVIPSTQIRLDHEPECKEIPFSEATHEQRMNVDNLVHAGGRKVEQIFRFNNGSYAFTCERDEVVYQYTSLVKVRIPT